MRATSFFVMFISLAFAPLVWSQNDSPEHQRDRDRDRQPVTDVEQEREREQEQEQERICPGIIDEDADGVCDACGATHDPEREREQKQERDCPAFIDEDGDGVCDLCSATHDPERDRTRRRFLRGDADGNGRRQTTDALHILRGLFRGERLDCADAADVNDDGNVDVTDPVMLLRALFCENAGPIPVPRRHAGNDPTPDDLPCD